ncbi:uncharacterized protein LOC120011597 isoform X2 [Tripterygium wilfordii]|uniref:uncharacterized protein LOC120011597 isoform X2 n=1 Tax=Tripterygium wilfordii TaxID=458696 RepID=UPI0018F85373|nr:uncharacterized protein LOC120011597 isoform X2 [Tripterygium wilfordii]
MSDALRGLAASEERNKVGPDYFGYFLHEVEQLISQDEDTLLSSSPSSCLSEKKCAGIRDKNTVNVSGSSFSHCILPRLSDSKNERLKLLLNEALKLLTSEVDQVLEPVISMCQLQSQIRTKKCMSSNAGPVSDGGEDRVPRKRPKLSSSSETAIFTHDSPNNCESFGEGDDDLQFLLKNDSLLVEETIKKHSDELSATGTWSSSLRNFFRQWYQNAGLVSLTSLFFKEWKNLGKMIDLSTNFPIAKTCHQKFFFESTETVTFVSQIC